MDAVSSGHAAALWTGLHLILLLVLSLLVVRQRQRHKIALGDEGVPELAQAIRAFGNATEYIPPALIGIAVLALVDASPLAVHLTGFVLFVGRVLHAVGLSRSGGSSFARTIGMTMTWLAYVFASVALLFNAVI
ncbi:MAPEG family protein [Phenylobacterium sp.]|uniref:MAPEG family protein n=1 Tax=Phenylobacterium sp. TaxID=1871053 RepID=UPI00286B8A2C|nr:MAPEG family protein [Phenylobacterium sp.]